MRSHKSRRDKGFTLLELTLALAVFMVMLGAAAQCLVSYYAALDMQRQRDAAAQHCLSVLSQMRQVRANNTNDFPNALLTQWPDAGAVGGIGTLRSEQVTVDYTDVNANPLEVQVTSQWQDNQGRNLTFSVTSLLTDQ